VARRLAALRVFEVASRIPGLNFAKLLQATPSAAQQNSIGTIMTQTILQTIRHST
jgi:hypothetical protein